MRQRTKDRADAAATGAGAFAPAGAVLGAGALKLAGLKVKGLRGASAKVGALSGAAAGAVGGAGAGLAHSDVQRSKHGKYELETKRRWAPLSMGGTDKGKVYGYPVPALYSRTNAFTREGRNVGYVDSAHRLHAPRTEKLENAYVDRAYRRKGLGSALSAEHVKNVGVNSWSGYRSDAGDRFSRKQGQAPRKGTSSDITESMDTAWDTDFSTEHRGDYVPKRDNAGRFAKMSPDLTDVHILTASRELGMPWEQHGGGFTRKDKKKGGFVKNPGQYEKLRGKGMSKERAARITNSVSKDAATTRAENKQIKRHQRHANAGMAAGAALAAPVVGASISRSFRKKPEGPRTAKITRALLKPKVAIPLTAASVGGSLYSTAHSAKAQNLQWKQHKRKQGLSKSDDYAPLDFGLAVRQKRDVPYERDFLDLDERGDFRPTNWQASGRVR